MHRHSFFGTYYNSYFAFADPPQFTEVAGNVEADVGDNVEVTCEAVGNPMPRISWSLIDSVGSLIIVSSETLTFNSIKEDDFGHYRCSAAVGEAFHTLKHDIHILKKGNFHL